MDSFLRVTATTLQQLVDRPPGYEIPDWCVTSFEVTIDESRVLGRGAFGRVVGAEWNGKVHTVLMALGCSDSVCSKLVAIKEMCADNSSHPRAAEVGLQILYLSYFNINPVD